MKYIVYVTIHNSYEVEADSRYEAETKVRAMDAEQILNDSDFKVTEIETEYCLTDTSDAAMTAAQ